MRQTKVVRILAVFALGVLGACASSGGAAGASQPRWVNEMIPFKLATPTIKECLVAVGNYKVGPQGEGFAKQQAQAVGRGNLAQAMKTTVSSEMGSVVNETSNNGGTFSDAHAKQVVKAIAEQVKIEGSQPYATYVDKGANEAYALMFLCLQPEQIKRIIEQAVSNLDGVSEGDIAAVRARAEKALKGL